MKIGPKSEMLKIEEEMRKRAEGNMPEAIGIQDIQPLIGLWAGIYGVEKIKRFPPIAPGGLKNVGK